MERLTKRAKDGSGNTYLGGNADVCWAGLPVQERVFCVKCPDLKNRDREKCGPCLLIDCLAAYEDTGLGPEEVATILRRTAEHDKAMEVDRVAELEAEIKRLEFILDSSKNVAIKRGNEVDRLRLICSKLTFAAMENPERQSQLGGSRLANELEEASDRGTPLRTK